MTVVDGLKANSLQVRPARGPLADFEVRAQGDVVGRVRDGAVDFDDRSLKIDVQGHRIWLRDAVRGDRVVSMEHRDYGATAIHVGERRFRLMREGTLPILWQVTEDFGGPQILRVAKLRRTLRFRAGADVDIVGEVELERLAMAVAVVMLDLGAVVEQAA